MSVAISSKLFPGIWFLRLGGALAMVSLLASNAGAAAPLRLSTSAWVADAPTRVAHGMGALEQVPGRVEITELDSGRASMEALMAAQADVALVANTPLALHLCRQSMAGRHPPDLPAADPPRVLASVALSNDTHRVLADARRGIRVPADLNGKRVGLHLDSSAHSGWQRFASFHGLTADAALIDLTPGALGEALLDGRVDAVVIWEPWDRAPREQLGDDAIEFPIRVMDSVNWLLVTRESVIDSRWAALQALLSAYLQAVDLLNLEPRRAAELYQRSSGRRLDPDSSVRAGTIWRVALDWSVMSNTQSVLEWCARDSGQPAASFKPRDYLAPELLEQLAPHAVLLPDVLRPALGGGPR